MYISVKNKLAISLLFGVVWASVSTYIAIPWINDLSNIFNPYIAWFIVTGLAIIPGFANAFLISSLIFDSRPKYSSTNITAPVTILIAAYNEAENIADTLKSIFVQNYADVVQIVVIDDCSTDKIGRAHV